MAKLVRIGDIAEQIRGVTFSKSDAQPVAAEGLVPVFTASNITERGLVLESVLHVPVAMISDSQYLRHNDVVITASSGSLSVVGRAAMVRSAELTASFGAFCKVLRPSAQVDPNFFAQYFKTPQYRARVSRLAAGANINNLRNADLDDLEIPLPSLAEQRRIASILDQADELRANRRRALALLDDLAGSIFTDKFGDVVANSRGFSELLFARVGTLDRGVSRARPRNAPDLLGGPHPLIQTGDVASSGGYIRTYSQSYSDKGLAQSKMWPSGTLAITIAANIAKTGILTFSACFPDSVVGFTPDVATVNVEYVRYWLRSLEAMLERQAPASAQKNINLAILRSLHIPVPPLEAQTSFGLRIEEIEVLRAGHSSHLAHLDELFTSVQHRAFRGEL